MKRFFCLILVLSMLLCSCGKDAEPEQQTLFCMNTVMNLSVWGEDAHAAIIEMTAELNNLEYMWSATSEHSILTALNSGRITGLGPESADLIAKVEALSERTQGAFDPKLRAVSELWNFTGDSPRIPSQEEIDAALETEKWDLGAALKGYAGQVCADLLSQLDVDRAILELGGNVQTYGEKPDGSPWLVGIQNPDGGDNLGIVSVTGTASVVTSGDYQRYFEADGVMYHHILDPETGYPANSGLRSVTIICRDGLTADCLSTALFVMGLEESIAFWQESNDFEAVFVTTDGTIYATEGANLSGCQYEVISR